MVHPAQGHRLRSKRMLAVSLAGVECFELISDSMKTDSQIPAAEPESVVYEVETETHPISCRNGEFSESPLRVEAAMTRCSSRPAGVQNNWDQHPEVQLKSRGGQ